MKRYIDWLIVLLAICMHMEIFNFYIFIKKQELSEFYFLFKKNISKLFL